MWTIPVSLRNRNRVLSLRFICDLPVLMPNARETERDILTTDENGYAKTKDLPYGVYVVHQIEGEEGKAFVKDFSVFIDENGKTYYYILNNRTITSHIRVEKRDVGNRKPDRRIRHWFPDLR
jgi:hypothetical protein